MDSSSAISPRGEPLCGPFGVKPQEGLEQSPLPHIARKEDALAEATRLRDEAIAAADAEFKLAYRENAARLQRKTNAAWDAYLAVLYGQREAA